MAGAAAAATVEHLVIADIWVRGKPADDLCHLLETNLRDAELFPGAPQVLCDCLCFLQGKLSLLYDDKDRNAYSR